MSLPKEVTVREVGPREGVQTSHLVISTEEKIQLIDALSQTGVKEIEITSLVKSEKIPQMADADEVIAQYVKRDGVKYTALYLNGKGFERGEASGRLQNDAWVNVAASETFLKKNNNVTIDEALLRMKDLFRLFEHKGKKLGGLMLSTAFFCGYEGAIPKENVLKILSSVISLSEEHGQPLQEVCLADTVGRADPEMVRSLVSESKMKYPDLEISLHLHDTLGLGLANVYAGLLEGVRIFDGSVGGLGGCPFMKGAAGNVATEDMVYLFHSLNIKTGISIDRYVEAAFLASKLFQRELPGRIYKIYQNLS